MFRQKAKLWIPLKRAFSTAAPPKASAKLFWGGALAGSVLTGAVAFSAVTRTVTPAATSTLPLSEVKQDPIYASPEETAEALRKIAEIVGNDNVTSNEEVRYGHTDSPWQYRHSKPGEGPVAVVFPNSTKEVSEVMKVCHAYRVPVTAFSGGTSLEGHFTPVRGGISLDLNNMNNVLAVHTDDQDVVVQPGVGWEALNDTLGEQGLMFGPDPGPGAEIGGMVGTSCSGTNAYHYGPMRQNVISLEVVLADGTVIRTKRRPRKSSAGYSMTELFVGAEGTLGIVTEATLKVFPRPKIRRIGVMSFRTLEDATDTVQHILQSGFHLEAMELMDDKQMQLINQAGTTNRKWDEHDTLLLKFAGPSEKIVRNEIDAVVDIARQHNNTDLVFAKDDDEGEELWAARKNSLFSVLQAAPEGYRTYGTDTAVPISQLSRIVRETQAKIAESGLLGSVLGHVGDGNFHVCFAYDPKTQYEKVIAVAEWVARRSLELEGTCTGEHGIGLGKRELLLEEVGVPAVDAQRKLKVALDPLLILNPGKIFKVSTNDNLGH